MYNAIPSVSAFFRGVLLNKTAPTLDWQLDEVTGKIKVQVGSGAPPVVSAKRWVGMSNPFGAFVETPFKAEGISETSPGSGFYETTLAALPSNISAGVPQAATFVQFEFEWPEPGSSFTISTPLWLSKKD